MLLVIFLRCPHLLYDTCVGVAEIGAHRNGDLAVCHEHHSESAPDHAGACGVVEEPFHQGEDVEYEDDSDDDYEGILKPAFAVDGDPDFESGEPLDGFEYLRRVRYSLLLVSSDL
jgi:survival of motor neuron protein-interacting protein 1